jgi:hypothetical protein
MILMEARVMKRANRVFAVGLLVTGLVAEAFCGIGYSVDQAGLFWVLGPDGNDIIFRMTLNIGLEETNVLDVNDITVTQDLQRVNPPDFADLEKEWTVSFVDGQNNLIGIDAVQRMYSWTDADYMMTRYQIVNDTGTPIQNAYISFEIVPTLDGPGEYGGETTNYVPEHEIGYMHESGKYFGLKLANMPIYSYRSPGYADFEAAESQEVFRYQEMANGSNSDFPLTDDYGFLVFLNTGQHSWIAGDSIEVYLALGYGNSDSSMTVAVLEAKELYDAWLLSTPFEMIDSAPLALHLGVNYPNPVVTLTTIPFIIDEAGFVSLDIMNVLGERVAAVHESRLSSGSYQMVWAGESEAGIPVQSGVYYCRLRLNGTSGRWEQTKPIVVAR